ncbi:hypothetical protein PR048_019806 [Dryococelus australis]|uniref:Uncharacterized protein n=1 Tax=Dryococelus australis TaxID=614101 RepID=A0ABQ9H4I4_9NEOP|nr:hypothetical protein PR048_019806 [Dryococelus australis]
MDGNANLDHTSTHLKARNQIQLCRWNIVQRHSKFFVENAGRAKGDDNPQHEVQTESRVNHFDDIAQHRVQLEYASGLSAHLSSSPLLTALNISPRILTIPMKRTWCSSMILLEITSYSGKRLIFAIVSGSEQVWRTTYTLQHDQQWLQNYLRIYPSTSPQAPSAKKPHSYCRLYYVKRDACIAAIAGLSGAISVLVAMDTSRRKKGLDGRAQQTRQSREGLGKSVRQSLRIDVISFDWTLGCRKMSAQPECNRRVALHGPGALSHNESAKERSRGRCQTLKKKIAPTNRNQTPMRRERGEPRNVGNRGEAGEGRQAHTRANKDADGATHARVGCLAVRVQFTKLQGQSLEQQTNFQTGMNDNAIIKDTAVGVSVHVPYCQVWNNTGYPLGQQPTNKHKRLDCTQDCWFGLTHERKLSAKGCEGGFTIMSLVTEELKMDVHSSTSKENTQRAVKCGGKTRWARKRKKENSNEKLRSTALDVACYPEEANCAEAHRVCSAQNIFHDPPMTMISDIRCAVYARMWPASDDGERSRQTALTRAATQAFRGKICLGKIRLLYRPARAGKKTGDARQNPPTSGIVRHDSHVRKSGSRPRQEFNPVRLVSDRPHNHTVHGHLSQLRNSTNGKYEGVHTRKRRGVAGFMLETVCDVSVRGACLAGSHPGALVPLALQKEERQSGDTGEVKALRLLVVEGKRGVGWQVGGEMCGLLSGALQITCLLARPPGERFTLHLSPPRPSSPNRLSDAPGAHIARIILPFEGRPRGKKPVLASCGL